MMAEFDYITASSPRGDNPKGEAVKTASPEGVASTQLSSAALTLDWELYQSWLDDSDIPESDKREFIETLWSIIVSFVDLGFGIHPLQQACERELALDGDNQTESTGDQKPNLIDSEITMSRQFDSNSTSTQVKS